MAETRKPRKASYNTKVDNSKNRNTKARTSMPTKRLNSIRKIKDVYSGIDELILFAVIALVLFGIIMVFSSSYYTAARKENNPYYYLIRQSKYAIIGTFGLFAAVKFPYTIFKEKFWKFPSMAIFIYIMVFFLMIYTNLFGLTEGGATRWISTPFGTLQSSELAKFAVILIVPYILYLNNKILDTYTGIIFTSFFVVLMAVVVMMENLSTGIIITLIGFGTIFVASKHTKLFILLGSLAVSGLIIYLIISSKLGGFRGGRFNAWLDPFSDPSDKGFQVIQSLYAVASGGFFGLGLGNSRQKLDFIPEAHNDIIFAIICEELGLFGATMVLILFGIIIWRGFKISITCPDIFGSLIAIGITIMMSSQVVINVAVVTNSIPNTGIPMPFVSSGGTALAVTMGLMGILLNISKNCYYKKR